MLKLRNIISYYKKIFIHLSLIIFACLGLLVLGGCDKPAPVNDQSDDHFTTVEVKNKIAHFSFEYRTYYHEIEGPYIIDDNNFQFTALTIAASKKTMPGPNPEPGKSGETVDMSYTPAFIKFNVGNALNRPYVFAPDRVENSIRSFGRWPNFLRLERKTVTISGTKAEMGSFQVDGFIAGPKMLYQAEVAFDYNDKKWDISLQADIALTEAVKADLEHILNTFKIIN
jgi:hypothetical protein